jgi:hypothetical protein
MRRSHKKEPRLITGRALPSRTARRSVAPLKRREPANPRGSTGSN